MFGLESTPYVIAALSVLSNFVVDLLIEGSVEATISYGRDYLAAGGGELICLPEGLPASMVEKLIQRADAMTLFPC